MKNIIRTVTGLSLLLIIASSGAISERGSSLLVPASVSAGDKYVSRMVKKQEMLTYMSRSTILPSSIFNRIKLEDKDEKMGEVKSKAE